MARAGRRNAPPENDLGGLRRYRETRWQARSPWIARCRLSSQRLLVRRGCPVKKVAPGTSRWRGALMISEVVGDIS